MIRFQIKAHVLVTFKNTVPETHDLEDDVRHALNAAFPGCEVLVVAEVAP